MRRRRCLRVRGVADDVVAHGVVGGQRSVRYLQAGRVGGGTARAQVTSGNPLMSDSGECSSRAVSHVRARGAWRARGPARAAGLPPAGAARGEASGSSQSMRSAARARHIHVAEQLTAEPRKHESGPPPHLSTAPALRALTYSAQGAATEYLYSPNSTLPLFPVRENKVQSFLFQFTLITNIRRPHIRYTFWF